MKSAETHPIVCQRGVENLRDLLLFLDDYSNIIMRLDFSSGGPGPLVLYYLMSLKIIKLQSYRVHSMALLGRHLTRVKQTCSSSVSLDRSLCRTGGLQLVLPSSRRPAL